MTFPASEWLEMRQWPPHAQRLESRLETRSKNIHGIRAMLAAVAFFAFMDTAMKLLSGHYPPMQVAAMRGMASLPLVCLYVVWRGKVGTLLKVRWPLHVMRAVLGIGMLSLFAYALKRLPLAETYSIFFVAPLLITAMSVPLLKEKVEPARWWAIAVGLLGVLVVLRPSAAGFFTLGGLAVLGSAAFYAISAITVRLLSRTDSSESMVFWLMAMLSIGAGALAAPDWVPLRAQDWLVITGMAFTGFIGQVAVTEAFRRGEASAIAPFEYTALAWAIGIDWWLWQTLPDRYTLLGAAIIVASGVYLVRRERVHVEAEHP